MRLDGWKAGNKKPDNLYKFFKALDLVTVFPDARDGGYSFVANDDFYGPFATQQNAQIEAEALAIAVRQMAADSEMPADVFEPVLADSRDEQESSQMTETAAAQAPQYVTRAAYDKLAAYTKQLAAEHNMHEQSRGPARGWIRRGTRGKSDRLFLVQRRVRPFRRQRPRLHAMNRGAAWLMDWFSKP
jgi:hypothetical protein